jgi:hypothetical protein
MRFRSSPSATSNTLKPDGLFETGLPPDLHWDASLGQPELRPGKGHKRGLCLHLFFPEAGIGLRELAPRHNPQRHRAHRASPPAVNMTMNAKAKRPVEAIEGLGGEYRQWPGSTIDPSTLYELEERELLEAYSRDEMTDAIVYRLTEIGRLWLKGCHRIDPTEAVGADQRGVSDG